MRERRKIARAWRGSEARDMRTLSGLEFVVGKMLGSRGAISSSAMVGIKSAGLTLCSCILERMDVVARVGQKMCAEASCM